MTNIDIPNSVVSIGQNAFSYSGLVNVTIPDSVKSIGAFAFENCDNLINISLSNSLTVLDTSLFKNCKNLKSIEISNNIIGVGSNILLGTLAYNNQNNWYDGCFIVDDCLLNVDVETKIMLKNTRIIADEAFDGCYKLKYLIIKGNHYSILQPVTNLETLVINELPNSHDVLHYFGWDYTFIPITLKNVILKDGCVPVTEDLFEGITGVRIYTEMSKDMARDWPTGWNNGNKVYYADEWIEVTFYDEDGNIISKEPQPIPQIIRQPYIENINNGSTSRVFIGWDIDENGIVDSVPATSSVNIEAHAIMADVDNTYRVTFYDMDRETIVKSYIVNYGEIVEIPEISKTGYTFNGWIGYYEGQEVTSNINAYASFTHEGEGHNYIKTIVNPKCAEKGYDCYECSICHETYKDNYVEPLGHNYGEWIIENQSSCTDEGLRYHICTRCENREEEPTEALGHIYVSHINKAATCEYEGEITYTCSRCNDVKKETIEMSAHHYEKRKASKWFIQVLIEKLLNMFFGYEGNDRYYYVCSECHHVMTIEEYNYTQTASAQESNCTHTSGTWTVVRKPSGNEYGIEILYCDLCGEGIDARYCGEPGGYLEGDIKEDGVVDNHDLFTLFKYLSNVETSVNEKALDINGDGKVNNKDITRLFQFISKYEVEVF